MTFDLAAAAKSYGIACGDCGAPMRLRTRNSDGKPFWGCSRWPTCQGTHGAHPDGEPYGVPADKETRQARIEAHRVFAAAWRARGMTKGQAYAWLSDMMGISRNAAHIGRFNAEWCRKLVERVQ